MSPERLVYMANQIGRFFATQGADEAVADTADHIRKFWEPRMRREIVAHLKAGGAGLDPVVADAIRQIASEALHK
jgi:formate dehydrogenase subunit delta